MALLAALAPLLGSLPGEVELPENVQTRSFPHCHRASPCCPFPDCQPSHDCSQQQGSSSRTVHTGLFLFFERLVLGNPDPPLIDLLRSENLFTRGLNPSPPVRPPKSTQV
jgi:hypothetical protein